MDLNTKAQWHVDFNGGIVPVFETPNGDLIKESGVIMQLAHDLACGNSENSGSNMKKLWPEDPIEAAKMRLRMEDFDKLLPAFFPVLMSRGEDDDKIKAFGETLHLHEQLATQSNGKWLDGSEEITMFDIHVVPMWEWMCSF
jgi:glutathione S-transferase